MSFWNDGRPMTGMRMPNAEKIACRFCRHEEKGKIGMLRCSAFPSDAGKPKAVLFDNASCPKFEKGEDLLPYEIEI